MRGDEDFALSVAVQINHDGRRETFGFKFNRILVGEMVPRLFEGEIAFMLEKRPDSVPEQIKNQNQEKRDQRPYLEGEEDGEGGEEEDAEIPLPHPSLLSRPAIAGLHRFLPTEIGQNRGEVTENSCLGCDVAPP
ncbi:hypothetical protein BHE74_00028491 [Ensete ventricosum]|nr:hypothetical protein GW17_00016558 [Ensete ventricosum]RWW64286.1 hypothetical protein BHE74_00028491 [Ensete ventricosum]RZR87328.1 hypothetical protein BHM03_00014697 [Ensete ventricosum]